MNLDQVLIALAALTALSGAARSTWSPCGLSMLSSLNPFTERSRGHRYGVTAAWFVAGATIGGATLGAIAFLMALAASAAGVVRHPLAAALIAAAVALLGAAIDLGVFGELLPVIRRQVNDRWLSRYRVWVYAGGFGWQIGTGITTYVMTSAVFVFLALAAVSGWPLAAMCVATGFGTARGVAVLLTSRASNPHALRLVHQRLDRATEPVRWIAIA
ncbi:MAG TPA: hypothetical protein VFV02_11455, partial [Acidimicrobiales bacterium]|nr:hypothetical protein [Acidimicrobiales bacterium]